MGRRAVDRRFQEFVESGQLTVRASALKGVLSSAGLVLLSAVVAGVSMAAFQEDGAASLKAWGCAFFAVLTLLGVAVAMEPVVRRQELVLNHLGLTVSSRRSGTRRHEMRLGWGEIEDITIDRRSSGHGTRTTVLLSLVPGMRIDPVTRQPLAFLHLPDGFAMSKKDLVALLERVHLSRG